MSGRGRAFSSEEVEVSSLPSAPTVTEAADEEEDVSVT